MKRIASMLAGFGLLFAANARADDKVEIKNDPDHKVIEKKHTNGHGHGSKVKVESKSHHRLGGGTVSTTKTTEEVDRPGLGNDSKSTVTETKETDEHGNVVRHEKKLTK